MQRLRLFIQFICVIGVLLLIATSLSAREWSLTDVPNVQLEDSTRYVTDPDDIISEGAETRINEMLRVLRRTTTAEMVVVALSDIDPKMDIDTYTTRLFNQWGIGKSDKDNGVMILLARDRHEVTIRTGKGVEGVLPDIIAGRIIRGEMIPYFRDERYDDGVEAGVRSVVARLSDPSAVKEISSAEADRRGGQRSSKSDSSVPDPFIVYLWLAGISGIVMLVIVVFRLTSTRKLNKVLRYRSLEKLLTPALFMAVIGLGLPLPAFLWLKYRMRRLRNTPRKCQHCSAQMRKLSEAEDNHYLLPWQDAEERLNSIDYDVWLCPECGEKDVIPYINRSSAYRQCPQCHARTYSLNSTRTLTPPTTIREGEGIKIYSCRHCGFNEQQRYRIPKIVVAPPIRRGFGSGGSSGFGRGGFGGGGSMGGGATGRW